MSKNDDLTESVGMGKMKIREEKNSGDFLSFIIKFATPIGLILFSLGSLIQIFLRG